MDPFKVHGPAVISFSGGRTSGYMLRRCLDAGFDDETFVVFSDTGKERPETLVFVDECERRWGVEIHHVSYPGGMEQIIRDRSYLPNVVARFCTVEGKIFPMMRFMVERGFDEWMNVVGIRHDEPRRVAKMRKLTYGETGRPVRPPRCIKNPTPPEGGWPRGAYEIQLPLADAKVTEPDVMDYWLQQSFDLGLKTYQGNCDLCFLKGINKRVKILSEDPSIGDWWQAMEDEIGGTFRKAQPITRLRILAAAQRSQLDMFAANAGAGLPDDTIGECFCTD